MKEFLDLEDGKKIDAASLKQSNQDNTWMLIQAVLRNLVLVVLLIGGFGLFLIHLSYQHEGASEFYYLVREIGGALFITALVSGSAKWYVAREGSDIQQLRNQVIKSELRKWLTDLTDEVNQQTATITKSAASLVALQDAGISKVYENRRAASADIKNRIEEEEETIKIIGISLNDFVRDEQTDLNRAWEAIQLRLKSQDKSLQKLNVQILLIDPDCRGAIQRAAAEGQLQTFSSRLRSDLEVSLNSFWKFVCRSNCAGFELKVYNTAPMLHLVWTPSVSFVEQYYFRPRHGGSINIPVLQCHSVTGHSGTPCLHEELESHFDWIWNNASVSLCDWITQFKRSGDRAMSAVGIERIFYDSTIRRQRILSLLKNQENTTIWIKGITLHAFFEYGDLFDALCDACERDTDIRILLIDPACEQARVRSFREFLIHNPESKQADFDKTSQERQPLFRDTNESIETIQDLLHRLGDEDGLKAKMFHSGPEAFMLLTDKAVLVEQYHFGKLDVGKGILGGEIPLIEYLQMDAPADPLNYPYGLFKNHFEFVWKHCSSELPQGA
jgi:hypothetical protein